MKYNYYGFKGDYVWHLAGQPFVPHNLIWFQPRLIKESEVVWCQGPRGGVRVVHINPLQWESPRQYGYIRPDTEAMKEFAWIKLKAQTLNQTA